MIPELDPADYDPGNQIPEELLLIVAASIQNFENDRQQTLISGAAKNYLKGTKIAYQRAGKKFVADEVEDDVYVFLKEYEKQIKEGYTVIQGEKVYWLKDRTLAERQFLFDTISESIRGGEGPDVTSQKLQDYFGMSKRHAELIARTETAYVQGKGTQDRYKKFGVKKVKWLLGRNPCPECQGYGNKVYTWEELPKEIPAHPRCFLPDTRYESPGGIVTGLRSWFDGQAIELVISNGVKLSVTPNHMLLTPLGFSSANLLRKGDNIIYSSGFKGVVSDDPDNNEIPARVEDIFNTLLISSGMTTRHMPVSPIYLHGDGEFCKGDIDIIRTNSFLRNGFEPAFFEHGHTDFFNSRSNSSGFTPNRVTTQLLKCLAFASDSSMSRSRSSSPFFWSRLFHMNIHGFRRPPWSNPTFLESSINGSSTCIENIRELIDGFTGIVEFNKFSNINPSSSFSSEPNVSKPSVNCTFPDIKMIGDLLNRNSRIIELQEIVDINILPYHGYVYDFETISSLCMGNGVISSNCTCALSPYKE